MARYSVEQIRAGISIDQLRAAISADGESVTKGSTDEYMMVYRTVRNEHELVASYRLCNGRVFEESMSLAGGAATFIRRVTQLERNHGPGRYTAESSLLDIGERNVLSVTWQLPDHVVTLSYDAPAPKIAEGQWLSNAVPSVCRRSTPSEGRTTSP